MQPEEQARFSGVVDHIAIQTEDIGRDVAEYQRIGFTVEALHDDWAMLRDRQGFGIALLPQGSKHPQHIGLRVDSLEELQHAADREGRPVKAHRDRSISFYTKGVSGRAVEVIYYPPDFGKN